MQIITHLLPVRNFEFISDKFKADEMWGLRKTCIKNKNNKSNNNNNNIITVNEMEIKQKIWV